MVTKGHKHLKIQQLKDAGLSVCMAFWSPPIVKGLTRSMFMATFSALQETIKNKIK